MADVMKTRVRERGPVEVSLFERTMKAGEDWRERAFTKQIVIRDEDVEYDLGRQGRIKFYINRDTDDKMLGVLRDWHVFLHDIRTHSGAHRHQGGLVIYVVEGEVVLVTEGGEQVLTAGMVAGFPKGRADGHHLQNRSGRDALVLEIGDRSPGDEATYPDVDLAATMQPPAYTFTRKDGSAF